MGILASIRSTILTLTRKMRKSLSQRGIAGTVEKIIKWPWKLAISLVSESSLSRRILREEGRIFDAKFNVQTGVDRDYGWMAAIQGPSWAHGTGYDPVSIRGFKLVMAQLNLDPTAFVFIDLGCGKGRSLFLASDQPFLEIIGVEYNRRLFEVATCTIASYSNPAQQCVSVRAEHMDALLFPFPELPCLLFLHNPFDEAILGPVIERLKASFRGNPRRIIILYIDAVHHRILDACPIFARVAQGIVPDSKGETYMIWETQPAGSENMCP